MNGENEMRFHMTARQSSSKHMMPIDTREECLSSAFLSPVTSVWGTVDYRAQSVEVEKVIRKSFCDFTPGFIGSTQADYFPLICFLIIARCHSHRTTCGSLRIYLSDLRECAVIAHWWSGRPAIARA